jgi:hypothetical protein
MEKEQHDAHNRTHPCSFDSRWLVDRSIDHSDRRPTKKETSIARTRRTSHRTRDDATRQVYIKPSMTLSTLAGL